MKNKRKFQIFNGIIVLVFVLPFVKFVGLMAFYQFITSELLKESFTDLEMRLTLFSSVVGFMYVYFWIVVKGIGLILGKKKQKKEEK